MKLSLTNPICSSAGLETSPEDELGGVRGAQGRREKSRERGQSAERKEEKNSRRLVHELEMKNAEIMREIARLRQNRATVADMEKNPGSGRGAGAELESLRMRKVELEFRLNELQETRKDLMCELEELMKVRPLEHVSVLYFALSGIEGAGVSQHTGHQVQSDAEGQPP